MIPIIQSLTKVVGSGEIITIAYNGGSHPGEERKIVPIKLSHEDLFAIDPESNKHKQYKIDKIAWIELSDGQHVLNTNVIPIVILEIPIFTTLKEYINQFNTELVSAGWYISQSENAYAIGTFFKNGKPRKTPSVLIQFFDRSLETNFVWDHDSGTMVEIKKELTGLERPWRVDSWRFTCGETFSKLYKAFDVFLKEARASDPATAKTIYSLNK
ncbi:MAG: hypothetical protein JXN64_13315 [Spirochaetes bacterium]|nr:hypothetical protein [Spirochaetota bacterium]